MCKKNRNPKFVKMGNEGIGIGFELELLHEKGFKSIKSFKADYRQYPSAKKYLAAVKRDYSVTGAEFVTHPAILSEHRQRIGSFLDMVKDSGFSSGIHYQTKPGLHFHIDRAVLGKEPELVLDHLIALSIFGGTEWDRLQYKVMGRMGYAWAKPGIVTQPGYQVFSGVDFYKRLVRASTWARSYRDEKFMRINISPKKTIEFRQGQATTREPEILGRMEFALGLCEYAVSLTYNGSLASSTIEEVELFTQFLEYKGYTSAVALIRN